MVTTVVSSLATAYSTFLAASTGDRVLLANGTYNNSTRKSLTKNSSSAVVEFGAENVGGAIITGQPIDLPANNTIFRGFDLQYSITTAGGTYVTIDGSDCQMTRNKIHFGNIASPGEQKWIRSKANNFTFDHNEVYGKTTVEDMLLVSKSSTEGITGNRCLYNYFHDFVQNPTDTKSEVIRFGESSMAWVDFSGEIAYNLIQDIDADTEVISVKCSNVNIHHNTLKNTGGSIVLRQAYNCTLNANTLINTGIRIYGSGHTITRNQIINNSMGGVSRPFYMGSADREDIPTVSGGSTPGTPGQVVALNAHYARTKNNYIANNIWANGNSSSGLIFMLGADASETFQPTGNTITANIIQASTGTLTDELSGTNPASWAANTVSNNILYATGTATAGDMPTTGYTAVNPNLTQLADGSYRCSLYLDTTEVGPAAP